MQLSTSQGPDREMGGINNEWDQWKPFQILMRNLQVLRSTQLQSSALRFRQWIFYPKGREDFCLSTFCLWLEMGNVECLLGFSRVWEWSNDVACNVPKLSTAPAKILHCWVCIQNLHIYSNLQSRSLSFHPTLILCAFGGVELHSEPLFPVNYLHSRKKSPFIRVIVIMCDHHVITLCHWQCSTVQRGILQPWCAGMQCNKEGPSKLGSEEGSLPINDTNTILVVNWQQKKKAHFRKQLQRPDAFLWPTFAAVA